MQINTKYNIGDEVFTYNTDFNFINGEYVNKLVPSETPFKISCIDIKCGRFQDDIDIVYSLTSETNLRSRLCKENELFSSLSECQRYCDNIIQ